MTLTPSRDIQRLLEVMAALRDPETGCPWDKVQTSASIASYTIEEAYEVVDAIQRGDTDDLVDELGDLLLQVVFHARMAEDTTGAFSFGDVVHAITSKMIRRHPHVFGDAAARARGMPEGLWDSIKAAEKRERAERRAAAGITGPERSSTLDDVMRVQPALAEASKLQKRARAVGFDWDAPEPIVAKLNEEIGELEAEISAAQRDKMRIADEIGDVLFTVVNLSRHLKVDPESALRGANAKFRRRFAHMEQAAGGGLQDKPLNEMEALWMAAKAVE